MLGKDVEQNSPARAARGKWGSLILISLRHPERSRFSGGAKSLP